MERIKRILQDGDTLEVMTSKGRAVVFIRNSVWVYEETFTGQDRTYRYDIRDDKTLQIVMDNFAKLINWQIMD